MYGRRMIDILSGVENQAGSSTSADRYTTRDRSALIKQQHRRLNRLRVGGRSSQISDTVVNF